MSTGDLHDLVISNGRLMDPNTGLDDVRNVGISGGVIRSITSDSIDGNDHIDAKGLIVSPGFIDLHSHGQDVENYEVQALDGVTTALELEVGVSDIDEWYAERKGKAAINFGASTGHIPIRMNVMNDPGEFLPIADAAHRPASDREVEEMKSQIKKGLERGALAVGFGLQYTPAASRLEVLEMFRLAAQYGASCHVHMRGMGHLEPMNSIEGLEELVAACAVTGAPLHVVHIQSSGLRATGHGITNFWPAQRADHLIVSIQHLFKDKYSLRVELFQKEMHDVRPRFENLYDPLGLIPEIQPDRVRLDPTSATSRGVEISLDRSSGPLTWWASYTLSKATDRINGVDEYRSWDQRHAFQGGIAWSNAKWDVALATSVHTGWPTTDLFYVEDGVDEDGEPEFVAIPGSRNVERLDSFASVDFRVSRSWKLKRGSLLAFFEVSNLTNRKNECCRDFDLEEDEDTGEEYFESDVDYSMGLLPAVGILWEF